MLLLPIVACCVVGFRPNTTQPIGFLADLTQYRTRLSILLPLVALMGPRHGSANKSKKNIGTTAVKKKPAQSSGARRHFAQRALSPSAGAAARLLEAMPWLLTMLLPLQRAAIQKGTEVQYLGAVWSFHLWLSASKVAVVSLELVDSLLSRYLQSVYEDGGPPSIGNKTLAAVLHFWPQLGLRIPVAFPCAFRCLRGWQKLCPPRTRAPLPLAALLSIVVKLLSWSEIGMAIAIWIGFHSYLRPRELSGLRCCQLVRPSLAPGAPTARWRLNLHPQQFLMASKTGYWDETIDLDDPITSSWLRDFLTVLREQDDIAPLWPFSHAQLVALYKAATQPLDLTALETSLYALRHGGPSLDWSLGRRALLEIKSRGRWTSDASLRRYQKSALLQREVEKMPTAVQNLAAAADTQLEALFRDPASATALLRSHGL